MVDAGIRRAHHSRRKPGLRRPWCCSFGLVPRSPEIRGGSAARCTHRRHLRRSKPPKPAYAASSHSSPSPSSKMGLGLIGPRRMHSPGRVSPIDSDAPLPPLPAPADAASVATTTVESETECADAPPKEETPPPTRLSTSSSDEVGGVRSEARAEGRSMDLRLSLKGKDGRCLVLDLDSGVLCRDSKFFAAMVTDARRKASDASAECRKIEVAEIEDLSVFKDTIELMYEKDLTKRLMKAGVHRCIEILEVSTTILFNRGVISCLKYLEAVPWNEREEDKLKNLFMKCTFDDSIAQDVLARLYVQASDGTQELALRLIQSVVNGRNGKARKELQTLVSCLFSKSSIYQKSSAGLSKEGLYGCCNSCLDSLAEIFAEACGSPSRDQASPSTVVTDGRPAPAVERVSWQVENLNWLLEVLIDREMGSEFVGLWAEQQDLRRLHAAASPMVRYELSRISASVFMAVGRGRVRCPGEVRHGVFSAWFGPMLSDFGWLRRCARGLDVRALQEEMGRAILTLSLSQQQALFTEWFRRFSAQGTECPDLSRAFQVWWRRSLRRTADAGG